MLIESGMAEEEAEKFITKFEKIYESRFTEEAGNLRDAFCEIFKFKSDISEVAEFQKTFGKIYNSKMKVYNLT